MLANMAPQEFKERMALRMLVNQEATQEEPTKPQTDEQVDAHLAAVTRTAGF